MSESNNEVNLIMNQENGKEVSYVGKICPFCKTEIKDTDSIHVCSKCGIPHHEDCWNENKGCTTFGCEMQYREEKQNVVVCSNCGEPLNEGQKFCPKCGTEKKELQKNVCNHCGAEMKDGQLYCANCGKKVDSAKNEEVNAAIQQFNTKVEKGKDKKKIIMIVAAIAVVGLILIVALSLNSGPNFKDIYKKHCDSTWAEVGSDGSYLSLDTNPFDEEDEGLAYYDAYKAIEEINKELGLPESLFADMGQTSSSDGKQMETFGEISVTWKYHPDYGLEVTYKK